MIQNIFTLLVFCLFGCSLNNAQALPSCINDGPDANCPKSNGQSPGSNQNSQSNLVPMSETSPWQVPESSDHSFVLGEGQRLDQYSFRSSSPLRIKIPINRVITKISRQIDPTGYEDVLNWHLSLGIITNLKITMPVFDVDTIERDDVYFNDVKIGKLKGRNQTWEINEFTIPITRANLGIWNGPYSPSTASDNEIKIDIDVLENGPWAVSVDWIKISFETVSPIALIHGNGSDGAFYDRRGFTQALAAQRMLYANYLNMPKPGNFIHDPNNTLADPRPNDKRVQEYLRQISKSFGVDSMHVVMHSKGGLDTKSYLAYYYPEDKNNFKILSYTTLSTPHNGSILADIGSKYLEGIKNNGYRPEFQNLPAFTSLLTFVNTLTENKGQENLTTSFILDFNNKVTPKLREIANEIDFHTTAADADLNGNGNIDILGCEDRGLINEGVTQSAPECSGLFSPVINPLYLTLRNKKSIQLTYVTRVVNENGGTAIVPVVSGIPNSSPQLNDTLVTLASGHGEGFIFPFVSSSHRKTYFGSNGKNHATIGNQSVANDVLLWIIESERRRGDLKDQPLF